jgi:BirA family biotin operon repressor/biotin-[acetyl-CoA-carboxylase] ligase
LKWPNDVLLDGAKVAGILIETVSDRQAGDETTWAVIGIGLNLALPQAALRRFNSANATALLKVEREQVLATVLDHLCATLRSFEGDGFTVFAERWNAYHAYAGQAVKILDQGRVLHQGVAVGVDQAGRLLLNTDDGPVAVAAGDVSLRLLGATAA